MRNRPRLDAPARVFSSKRTHPRFGSDGRIETALSSETQNPGHGGGPHPFDPVAAEVFTQAVKPGANEIRSTTVQKLGCAPDGIFCSFSIEQIRRPATL